VFENTVLRRIFGPKRDEMTRGWRKLLKEDEMGRACSTNGGEEECIYDIGVKTRRKGTTGKTKT
jgi:hypothetical protein